MISFIPYILKLKNYLIAGLIIFFLSIFIIFYFKTKEEIINLNNQVEEYKKIEEEVKNQNLNVKQNVEIIKKRIESSTNYDDDRLLKQIFGDK